MTPNKLNYPVFQMWGGFRAEFIRHHEFYVEQAKKRLLSRFGNISTEADQAADAWLKQRSQDFDPEHDDPGIIHEDATQVGVEFYQLLTEMHNRTRLSVIAGFFHEWEKSLREWLVRELNHFHHGEHMKAAIWRKDIGGLYDLFGSVGWGVRSSPFFLNLNICRLVVNTYKHGDGASFKELATQKPYFFIPLGMENLKKDFPQNGFPKYMNMPHHSDLNLTDDDLEQLSNAIIEFWKAVPERALTSQLTNPPHWFIQAIEKDRKQREGNT